MGLPNKLKKIVIRSLLDNPSGWRINDTYALFGNIYSIRNTGIGCEIWIASGRWGLSVEFKKDDEIILYRSSVNPTLYEKVEISKSKYGGVTFLSVLGLELWRYKIYRLAISVANKRIKEIDSMNRRNGFYS